MRESSLNKVTGSCLVLLMFLEEDAWVLRVFDSCDFKSDYFCTVGDGLLVGIGDSPDCGFLPCSFLVDRLDIFVDFKLEGCCSELPFPALSVSGTAAGFASCPFFPGLIELLF